MAISKVTPAVLAQTTAILEKDFQDSYQAGLALANNWVLPHMSSAKDTVKKVIDFIFYGDVDEPEQVGELQDFEYTEFMGYQLELSYQDYKNGAFIPRKTFLDDDLGILPEQVQKLGAKYALIWRFLATEILNNGATAAVQTYDGVPLFDNAHIVGQGTFDNLLAGTGTTTAQIKTDLQVAYTAMQAFVNDMNETRDDNTPTHMVTHPSIWFEVLEILRNASDPRDNKNTENVSAGLVELIKEPRLTDTNDWFLFRSVQAEKPFVPLTNKSASTTGNKLVQTNKPNVNGIVIDELLTWGIHQINGLHPTHPHLFLKTVNA